MAHPVKFNGMNDELDKPSSMDDLQCSSLPVYRNGVNCVSCWEFSDEEIQEIIKTKRVYISLWSGRTQPPIYIGSESDVRQIIADNGVWKLTPN